MLMDRKEMENWLIQNKRLDKKYKENWLFIRNNDVPKDLYIPWYCRGVYDIIGTYTFWDEVGGIASNGYICRPIKGGKVLYDVE